MFERILDGLMIAVAALGLVYLSRELIFKKRGGAQVDESGLSDRFSMFGEEAIIDGHMVSVLRDGEYMLVYKYKPSKGEFVDYHVCEREIVTARPTQFKSVTRISLKPRFGRLN